MVHCSKATGFGKIGQVVANHITKQTSSSSSTFADAGGSETTIVTTASSSKNSFTDLYQLENQQIDNTLVMIDLYKKNWRW